MRVSFLRLNSFSLLVEVPPSLKAARLAPSLHLNQLHRETSKQQQQQKTPSQVVAAEWGVPYGSETARAIRKRSSMGAEGDDYFSLYFRFVYKFFHNELKILRRHPAK